MVAKTRAAKMMYAAAKFAKVLADKVFRILQISCYECLLELPGNSDKPVSII